MFLIFSDTGRARQGHTVQRCWRHGRTLDGTGSEASITNPKLSEKDRFGGELVEVPERVQIDAHCGQRGGRDATTRVERLAICSIGLAHPDGQSVVEGVNTPHFEVPSPLVLN